MSDNKYTEWLIKEVKLLAKTIYDHADEIVGSMTGTTDFDIQIHIPTMTDIPDELPTIEVSQSYFPSPNEFMGLYNEWHKKTWEKTMEVKE